MTNATMARLADRLAPLVSERLVTQPRPADLAGGPEALLTEIEAAAILALRPSTLCAWRGRGTGPKFRRIGDKIRKPVRYQLRDILVYRDRGIVTPRKG